MSNEQLPFLNHTWCFVALTVILTTLVGCSKQESTDSATKQSSRLVAASDENTATNSSRDKVSAVSVLSEPKASTGCSIAVRAPGVHKLVLEHGGWKRKYTMSVPDSQAGESLAHPLLIVMHGFGGSGNGMRNAIGRENGMENKRVVLYPDGAGNSSNERGWNSGHPECCGAALRDNVDDVAFLRELVNVAAQETCVDLNRVYATGFSNGGDMAQRFACDASDMVAAVTSVAGRFDYHASACNAERPVPTILYRGARDRTVPYKSNLLGLVAIKTIPAMEGFEKIARNHECRGEPQSTLATGDTSCLRFNDCQAGFELSLCTSSDSGHCWPGTYNCPKSHSGGANVFSASEHMQEFFGRHALSP